MATTSVVSHKFLHLPFVVSLSNHEWNRLEIHALRQASPELAKGLSRLLIKPRQRCSRIAQKLNVRPGITPVLTGDGWAG